MTNKSVSHAEGGVDELVRRKFFSAVNTGVFVEVGAARPDYLSTSLLFRQGGWKVIAIEPNPVFCDLQRAAGYEVLQYACADFDADDAAFQVVDSHRTPYEDGGVTFESFSAIAVKEGYRAVRPDLDVKEIRVAIRRLDTILGTHAPEVSRVDILSIDVEGWELEVLRGLSMERYRPTVVIMENFVREPNYPRYMLERQYVLWKRIGPNEVYVRGDVLPVFARLVLGIWGRLVSMLYKVRGAARKVAFAGK